VHLSGFEPVQVSATDKIARREVKGAKNFYQEVLDTAREMINFAENLVGPTEQNGSRSFQVSLSAHCERFQLTQRFES